MFEASGLIKEGLIREWSRLSPDDIKALRAYLLAYVTGLAANSIFLDDFFSNVKFVQLSSTFLFTIIRNSSIRRYKKTNIRNS